MLPSRCRRFSSTDVARAILVALLLGVGACAPAAQAPATATPGEDPLRAAYAAALEGAMYPRPSGVTDTLLAVTRETEGLRWDDQGRLLVITWTRARFFTDPPYAPGYAFPLYGETFFTTGDQVRRACAGLTGDALGLRVEQLLGLPPGGGRDAFLTVWIEPSALFRPCADPDIRTRTCPIAPPLVLGQGGEVSWSCGAEGASAHQQWMCNTWVQRYGASDLLERFPWTALGYTYDWAPDGPSGGGGGHIGPTELVAPRATEVVFEALIPNDEFCAAN